MIDLLLILGVGWLAVSILALAIGRVAGRADRRTSELLEGVTAGAPMRPVPPSPAPAPASALRGSKVRVGPA